tara:strand:- start:234 stop:542 length:309 start_codon:yes stop_codon:yes gene_type:complete
VITSNGLKKLGFTPEEDFSLRDDGDGPYIHDWMSASPQPSEAEIEAADAEWQAEYDAHEYARLRATAYAPIGDQLDMQYHDQQDGTTTWTDHVAEIKARYPK